MQIAEMHACRHGLPARGAGCFFRSRRQAATAAVRAATVGTCRHCWHVRACQGAHVSQPVPRRSDSRTGPPRGGDGEGAGPTGRAAARRPRPAAAAPPICRLPRGAAVVRVWTRRVGAGSCVAGPPSQAVCARARAPVPPAPRARARLIGRRIERDH